MSLRRRIFLFLGVTAVALASVFSLPRFSQDAAYHAFADTRPRFGIPNFLDVVSNAPFLIAGLWGLIHISLQKRSVFEEAGERLPYFAFFIGIALTCIGSVCYHWSPRNETLALDRIPMAITFMGLFAAVIGDRIDVRAGRKWLFPMLAAGIFSVLYWYFTEIQGAGDLRPYLIIQYYTLAAILLLIILFPARYTHSGWLIAAGGAYILAKIFEALDRPIFYWVRISGHTLKHIAASLAAVCILEMLRRRSLKGSTVGNLQRRNREGFGLDSICDRQ